MNVLFVDDQISVLEGISSAIPFRELCIDIVRYATGADAALDVLRTIPIDIMLCDIEMPGEDGLKLIAKAQKLYPDLITILLTSHADFEYAQESIRLGCFDYIVQPSPYEEIEAVLRRAMQYRYEQSKKNQLYEVGRRMQTGEMELLDRVAMSLFSSDVTDVQSARDLLNLIGYAVSPEKKVQLMLLSFEQFQKTDNPIVLEKEIHKTILHALKEAEITYPLIPLSTVDRRREFILLVFSALQEEPKLELIMLQQFFERLCQSMHEDAIRCYIGQIVTFDALREEYKRVRESIGDLSGNRDIIRMDYTPGNELRSNFGNIAGSDSRWRSLLTAGQYHILKSEFDDCLDKIAKSTTDKNRALCDLHQRMTHMFFTYFYDKNLNIHSLFQDHYSYYDYMNSYSNADLLRNAMAFMMKKVSERSMSQMPQNDIEKAKSYIQEKISDPITVKDVAEYVGLSAEYFTKLFKKEVGQNIKEYITQMKVETAKDMLEKSGIPVGMVALELGYSNFSHFTQVFRKYENSTPSEYRAKHTGEKN